MATSFGALCSDFYINHKLALKMDLPAERETVLHFMDRVRKAVPSMNRFRRYDDELALESSRREPQYRWLALRRTSVRAGHVNPDTMEQAYQYHRMILELTPHYLTISPIDVDFVELMFGFDLECRDNHDRIVYEALFEGSPMANLLRVPDTPDAGILDVQPALGVSLSGSGDMQAYFEVKTRQKSRRGSGKAHRDEPISLFLTLRRYGPINRVDELPKLFNDMAAHCDKLATDRLVPDLLTPIAREITSSAG